MNSPNKKPNIAIIGGGYSGMAAAIRVIERGGTPVVYEAARILGGRARRVEYLGHTLDNGQHILSGAYRELLRLMDVIGVSARVYDRVPLKLTMPPHFALRAPLLPAPLHMAVALLRAKGLTFSDRLQAIRFMRALEKAKFVVDESITVAALLGAHQQSPNLIAHLWQPLTVSALNTPIATASAQVFANVLRDALAGAREASDLLLPKVDLTALFPEPAAVWITQHGGTVKVGAKVSAIRTTETAVAITVGDETEQFDAAIFAVGPHQRSAVSLAVSGENASNAASLLVFDKNASNSHTFESITTIYFGFDTADNLPDTMFGQTPDKGFAHWFFDRRQLSDTPESPELIVSAVISACGPHDDLDNEALAAAVLDELKQFAPTLPNPAWNKVIREKFATFACTPDAPRPSPISTVPRLFLAGDDVANPERNYPATLEGTVRNGVAAADAAIEFLTPP
jgi:hydroxysqualene dehydroxylase